LVFRVSCLAYFNIPPAVIASIICYKCVNGTNAILVSLGPNLIRCKRSVCLHIIRSYNICCSNTESNNINSRFLIMIKSERMGLAANVARLDKKRNILSFSGKARKKRPLGSTTQFWR
jgi:hypothetical protein